MNEKNTRQKKTSHVLQTALITNQARTMLLLLLHQRQNTNKRAHAYTYTQDMGQITTKATSDRQTDRRQHMDQREHGDASVI